MEEDLLFCRLLPNKTTSEEIVKLLNYLLTTTEINWDWCYGICTDGVALRSSLAPPAGSGSEEARSLASRACRKMRLIKIAEAGVALDKLP